MNDVADDLPVPGSGAADEVARLVSDARAYWERGALDDSEEPLRRALEQGERVLGVDHRLVAVVLSHLGWLAATRGRHDEAVSDYRRALAIREARLGPNHPDTLHNVEALAEALFLTDEHSEEADTLAVRAIDGYETAGRDDAEFAGLIADAGFRRYWTGRYAEAEPMLLRALAMRERLLGPGDLATAGSALRLAILYDYRTFDVDPEPYYRKALAGYEAARGGAHVDVLEGRFRLVDYLHRQGRADEATPMFEGLIATLSAGGPVPGSHDAYWMMLTRCGRLLRDAGRDVEAEALEEQSDSYDPSLRNSRAEVEQAEQAFGADSAELAEALGRLANACALAGQADEADEAARRALSLLQARLGPDDPSVVSAADRLAKIRDAATSYAADRRIRRAEEHRARLARRHHVRMGGEVFDAFTSPWRDGRRPGLFRAYFSAAAEHGKDDVTGAFQAILSLTFVPDCDEQWGVILELIAESPGNPRVLQHIAAGPLEGFMGRFDSEVIDRVEAEAARNPKFRRVLSGVWRHKMSDAVWKRVRAIQATVSDPLPEMPPFGSNTDTLKDAPR